jgi:cell division protein FtsB
MRSDSPLLIYGAKLIYLPPAGKGAPRLVRFLTLPAGSPTILFGRGAAFTADDSVIQTYSSLQEIIDLQSKDQRKFLSLNILSVENLSFLHAYSPGRLDRLLRAYAFLSRVQGFFTTSRRLCLLPGMASTDLGGSSYFYRLRKWPRIIRLRFYINTICTLLFGIFKIPAAIVIFLYDLIRVAFAQYGEFRMATAAYTSARRRKRIAHAFQTPVDDALLSKEVTKARDELLKARENYTKLNMTLLTLLVSIVAFIISGYFAVEKINHLTLQVSNVTDRLAVVQQANADLTLQNASLTSRVDSLQSLNSVLTAIIPSSASSRQSTSLVQK